MLDWWPVLCFHNSIPHCLSGAVEPVQAATSPEWCGTHGCRLLRPELSYLCTAIFWYLIPWYPSFWYFVCVTPGEQHTCVCLLQNESSWSIWYLRNWVFLSVQYYVHVLHPIINVIIHMWFLSNWWWTCCRADQTTSMPCIQNLLGCAIRSLWALAWCGGCLIMVKLIAFRAFKTIDLGFTILLATK